MILKVLAVGPFQSNCYILADKATREAAIIDPGDEPEKILRAAKGLEVKLLLLTHGHLDHVSGTRRLKEATGAPILIHEADRALYEGLRGQYAAAPGLFGLSLGPGHDPLPADGTLTEGQEVAFGPRRLRVIHTPGHTPGCCSFLGDGLLFPGDTLFCGGIGRTDLGGGDLDQEMESIRSKLYTLDPRTAVYPGHGPETSIGDEKAGNPYTQE
jgi:glyoxylase-like metal-dependent hydrolase (beta-lactamase superfamily II)